MGAVAHAIELGTPDSADYRALVLSEAGEGFEFGLSPLIDEHFTKFRPVSADRFPDRLQPEDQSVLNRH
jgi:hypothetical protein